MILDLEELSKDSTQSAVSVLYKHQKDKLEKLKLPENGFVPATETKFNASTKI